MKRLALKFAFMSLLAALSVSSISQDVKTESKTETKTDKKKETEQIIITIKGDKKEKITIEVDGDKILVNGKPYQDLTDDEIKVLRNKYKSYDAITAYGVPHSGTYSWNYNSDDHDMTDADENRAMLGVVTEKTEQGAKVSDVTENSAAKKAGIKSGDIITKIDDTKVTTPDELTAAVRKHKPGDKVTVTLLRDKKEQKLTAELGKWKGVGVYGYTPGQTWNMRIPEFDFKRFEEPFVQPIPRTYGQTYSWSGNSPRLGLSVQDTDDGKGVKVIEVDEDSNAAKAGVKEDDIITQFNDKAVNSADEVVKMLKESKDKPTIKLQVKRAGKTQTIEVKMPRKLKTADL